MVTAKHQAHKAQMPPQPPSVPHSARGEDKRIHEHHAHPHQEFQSLMKLDWEPPRPVQVSQCWKSFSSFCSEQISQFGTTASKFYRSLTKRSCYNNCSWIKQDSCKIFKDFTWLLSLCDTQHLGKKILSFLDNCYLSVEEHDGWILSKKPTSLHSLTR